MTRRMILTVVLDHELADDFKVHSVSYYLSRSAATPESLALEELKQCATAGRDVGEAVR